MNIFEILGPVMIGPSSSHTAGAVRAGNVAARLLGRKVARAEIILYGSLAKTYYGHGTDCAIIGGLLGFSPDDENIVNSHELAKKTGLEYSIELCYDEVVLHPNTVRLNLFSENTQITVCVQSLGGGAINVSGIDDAEVSFTTEYYTTVIFNEDKSGVMADVCAVFAKMDINIAFMKLFRTESSAIMVIESDEALPQQSLDELKKILYVNRVIAIAPFAM